jgi:hypothetical protein
MYWICSAGIGVCKKCKIEQNFMTVNKDYLGKYLNNSKIWNKADDLKCNFWSLQAIFSKPTNRVKVATIVSLKIAEIFPKWRKCLKVALNTNWGKVLKFVYFLALNCISQLMSVTFPYYLFFIHMFTSRKWMSQFHKLCTLP